MILPDKNMKCSTKETTLRKEPHKGAKFYIRYKEEKNEC